jgi:hypothetical protein
MSNHQQDECAILNDHIFGNYHKIQAEALKLVTDVSMSLIQRKKDKDSRLRRFVDLQTTADETVPKLSSSSLGQSKASKAEAQVHLQVCQFIESFEDSQNDNVY